MKRLLIVFVLFVGLGASGLPVNAQVKKADKALKKLNYDEALGYAEEALQKKPEDAKAFEVKGRIYQAMASNAEDAEHVALLGQMMEAFHQAASLDTKMAEKVQSTLTIAYITQFQRGIDTHYKVYVGLNLVVSAVLVVGWSAFGALAVGRAAAGSTVWLAGVLYLVGGLASYVAFIVETAFYKGGLYKVVTLPLALVSYLFFSVWPTVGWILYGWFFEFFGRGR